MMHDKRRFQIADVLSAEELVEKLVDHMWCCCQGFRLGGYLFLNDSTGPDGAQEYAIVRAVDRIQCESITFSWCDKEKALEYVNDVLAGKFSEPYGRVRNGIETPANHGRCGACA